MLLIVAPTTSSVDHKSSEVVAAVIETTRRVEAYGNEGNKQTKETWTDLN